MSSPSCLVHYPAQPETCFLCASDTLAFNNPQPEEDDLWDTLHGTRDHAETIYPEIDTDMVLSPRPFIAPLAKMAPIPPFQVLGPRLGKDFYTVTFDTRRPWFDRCQPLSTHDHYCDRFALEPEEQQLTRAREGFFEEKFALNEDEGGPPLSEEYLRLMAKEPETFEIADDEPVSPKPKCRKILPLCSFQPRPLSISRPLAPSPLATVVNACPPSITTSLPTISNTPAKPTDEPKVPRGLKRKADSDNEVAVVAAPHQSTKPPRRITVPKHRGGSDEKEEETIAVDTAVQEPPSRSTRAAKRQRKNSTSSDSSLSGLTSLFGDESSSDEVIHAKSCKCRTCKSKASKGKAGEGAARKSLRKKAKVSYSVEDHGDSDSDSEYNP